MKISNQYINGLKKAYLDKGLGEAWERFEKIKHGASAEDLLRLEEKYPNIPESLLDLLKYADGTYYRKYGDEEICLYFLGSDVDDYEYPYYLMSAEQMLKSSDMALNYKDYIERQYEGVEIDERITKNADTAIWLHFSDCMNNGGTSVLFIDFTPSEKGKIGQIGRFLHDPDEFAIIADSFDEYLKMLLGAEYSFVNDGSELQCGYPHNTHTVRNYFELEGITKFSLELDTDFWLKQGKRIFYGYCIPENTYPVRFWNRDLSLYALLRPGYAPIENYEIPRKSLPPDRKERADKYEEEITALKARAIPFPTQEEEKEYADYYDAEAFTGLAKEVSAVWRNENLPLAERFAELFAMLTEAYGLIGGIRLPARLMRDDGRFAMFLGVFFTAIKRIINTAEDSGVSVPESVSEFHDFLDGFLDALIAGGNRIHGLERSKTPEEEEETSDLEGIADSEDGISLEERLNVYQTLGEDTLSLPVDRIRFYRKAIELMYDMEKSEDPEHPNELPDNLMPFIERIKSELLALEGKGENYWKELIGKTFLENANEWIEDEEGFEEVTEEEFINGIYPRSIFMELHEKNGTLSCMTKFYFSNENQIMDDQSMIANICDGKIDFELMPYVS